MIFLLVMAALYSGYLYGWKMAKSEPPTKASTLEQRLHEYIERHKLDK